MLRPNFKIHPIISQALEYMSCVAQMLNYQYTLQYDTSLGEGKAICHLLGLVDQAAVELSVPGRQHDLHVLAAIGQQPWPLTL